MKGTTLLVLMFVAVSCGRTSASDGEGTPDAAMICGGLGEQCCNGNGCDNGLTCTPNPGPQAPSGSGGTCVAQAGPDAQLDSGNDGANPDRMGVDDAGVPRRAPVPLSQDSDGTTGDSDGTDDAGVTRRGPVPLSQNSGAGKASPDAG